MDMRISFLLIVSACCLFGGCDVSSGYSNGGAGSNSQAPDPVVVDFPVAYVERPIPIDPDTGNVVPDDVLDPGAFNPGAKLVYKDRASVPAAEVVVTDGVFPDTVDMNGDPQAPLYDVKDLSVSDDGKKLLFAMRAPEIPDADVQPTWNIWEYDSETKDLHRVIQSDLVAEQGEDVAPHYLPDGRIVFSSNRQRRSKAILLDENKPQFAAQIEDGQTEMDAYNLHTMAADGLDIEQITFNQSHDLEPTVLDSGQVLFLRWDNYMGRRQDRLSLYKVNPDGSDLQFVYGYHSQNTGTNATEAAFIKPLQMPNGEIMVSLRSRQSVRMGGDIVTIDVADFSENDQAIDNSGNPGPAQKSATVGQVNTDGTISPRGHFNSAYPIDDGTGRLLVSWSACFVQGVKLGVYLNTSGELIDELGQYVDSSGKPLAAGSAPVLADPAKVGTYPCTSRAILLPDIAEAQPMYGLWTYDPSDETQSPVALATANTIMTDAVVMKDRTPPTYIPPVAADTNAQTLVAENVGVVSIRSVYDFHGIDNSPTGIAAMADPTQVPPAARPARFIRIMKAVSIPDQDTYDFNRSAFGLAGQMKDILGYVPIEPDGSAEFKVPADVAFTFQILDANGRRVPGYLGDNHSAWLTVRPGETRECNGCHSLTSQLPHGRDDAQEASANLGAVGGSNFPNTQLLDAFDTPQAPPNAGETMAEYYARVIGPRTPSVDIHYSDEWTDANVMAKAASFDYKYADMPSGAAPTTPACQSSWNSLCRIVINYLDVIQPIWETPRQVLDGSNNVIADNTCTVCHAARNAMGQAQVPAGQLELTSDQSNVNTNFVTSYAELFLADVPQELLNGALVDQTQQAVDANGNLVFQTDANGNLILDTNGDPIPVMVSVPARPSYLSAAGARANTRFFNLFAQGGSHQGMLNDAELKLISEWLDIGGQYYNNPFDAPEN